MKRYILTGTPGAGKTAILRQLEVEGYAVVEEAATDVIALEQARGVAEPWTHPSFIDAIVRLQRERRLRYADFSGDVQFHDRSPICTYALARFLGFPIPDFHSSEIERISREAIYRKKVFFVRNLGFVTPTSARRIGYEEALRFERVHEEAYRDFGFTLVAVVPGPLGERVGAIRRSVGADAA